MKSFLLLLTSVFMTGLIFSGPLTGCSSGPGTSEGSTGTVGVSFELVEPAEGQSYRTQDNFTLVFTTFAFSFSKLTLGNVAAETAFAVDFYDEEIAEVLEIEDVPAGEYDDISLTLAPASGLTGASALQLPLKNAAKGTDVTESLNGKSVLIVADASGGNTCTLRVELTATDVIPVDAAENDLDVEALEEAELLIQVDPSKIFGTLAIANICTGGATVTLSSTSHADLAEIVKNALLEGEAFSVGNTAGHGHNH